MLQIVLSADSPPLVDQIVTAIRTRIDDRILRPGARLPPIRQFAEQYGVAFHRGRGLRPAGGPGPPAIPPGLGLLRGEPPAARRAAESSDAIERAIDAAWLMREMARTIPTASWPAPAACPPRGSTRPACCVPCAALTGATTCAR
jgi:hypothetical protein